ncbi:flavodoxin [Stomatohabitans albus]|uniref:flavodoxin n=1 Tax=Stomatohabitans albus TaxID=3110766 RepID=UPI00300CE438
MNIRRNVSWLVALISSLVLMLTACSQSGTSATGASESGAASGGGDAKALVVYFSRTKGIEGGDLDIGHTKRVAMFIKDYMKADEYEIVPAKDYPDTYDETVEVAEKELDSDARPEIKNPLPDVSGYDTVFVGAPVWYDEYPKIIETFLDGVDLKGKTIVPFVTHEGSEMGGVQTFMEKKYSGEKVLKGLPIEGPKSAESKDAVEAWLKELGF